MVVIILTNIFIVLIFNDSGETELVFESLEHGGGGLAAHPVG
jgi:hypothetical protein